MDRFFNSPRSPLIDAPMCDSDEEVFCGPVTSKELQKASQLKRQTQYFFPAFDWKPSPSPLARKHDKPAASEGPGEEVVLATADKPNLSQSADSLESHSYVTSSEKPLDSSKGDYWSAISGDSLNTPSRSPNDAAIGSKFSVDSLESIQAHSSESGRCLQVSSHVSEDSLEEISKHQMNVARIHLGSYNDSLNSEHQPRNSNALSDSSAAGGSTSQNAGKLVSEAFLTANHSRDSESSTHQVCSDDLQAKRDETFSLNTVAALTATYEVLPDVEVNGTYCVQSRSESCHTIDLEQSDSNLDLPKEVAVDKDGGFLSILSEAALYHASQLKGNSAQTQDLEESVSTTQSLEDRFKVFGINADELEDQQLSTSIMYVTGRESHLPSSETESNTYFTGRSSSVGPSEQTAIVTSSSSLAPSEYGTRGTVDTTGNSHDAASDCLQYSSELNHRIENSSLGSATRSLPDLTIAASYQPRSPSLDDVNTIELSSNNTGESSEISGVYELNPALESQDGVPNPNDHGEMPSCDDSNASSYVEEMNDTLEEYEMMMRYGVDYILGKKGNKQKGDHTDHHEGPSTLAKNPYRVPISETGEKDHSEAAPPSNRHQRTSSVEYLDAVNVSPCHKKMASSQLKDRKVSSPLHKQVLKGTPQKAVPSCASSGSIPKVPSKLPRVASSQLKDRKVLSPLHKQVQSSPHCNNKQPSHLASYSSEPRVAPKLPLRPVTPSSETKSNLFKKPVTPASSGSRIPKTLTPVSKSNNKILEKIQSPVGAYIHNSPSPVLVTNIKARPMDRAPHEKEMHARAVWRAGEVKSLIPKAGGSQATNTENINPNVGCGLPPVKYTRAPCIKLDETTKLPMTRGGEKITKLLDAPSPQVIKHEGRLRVNCGSPQLAAKMQSMADTFDDSMVDIHSVSGDISVCVTQQAFRTDTLGH